MSAAISFPTVRWDAKGIGDKGCPLMRDGRKKLPIGIDNFEKIRTNDFYYVDKSGLIIDLLEGWCEVTLFTRPRRFGKSLNISMLESFFAPDTDKSIFDGLRISKETQLCEEYMGQYPVISVSLKDINASGYDTAAAMAVSLVREAAQKYENVLLHSTALSASEKEDYSRLLSYDMPEQVLYRSLKTLSRLLEKHYGRKVIILIDEYDVPLAKAHEQGYYDQMVLLIRNLFEQTLKSNSSLQFAILTGCMRISKESIFTGLNNLRVLGIADERSDEAFGFTDQEVKELLAYYDLSDRYEEVREWYDGYHFGSEHVYCPWDVINYIDHARYSAHPVPENYWVNSSGNAVVRRFIERSSNVRLRGELEELVNGGAVEKTLRQDLTYPEMYTSEDNLWSVLFTTGYLTQQERLGGNRFRLVLPNREIRSIYTEQIMEWFRDSVESDGESLRRICDALCRGDADEVQACFNNYLERTISIRDTYTRKDRKENFYHGILIGILGLKETWEISSNEEAGRGYSDIIVRDTRARLAIVIEVKYDEDGDLEAAANRALKQIDDKHYADKLGKGPFDRILKYGVACYQKECRVVAQQTTQ